MADPRRLSPKSPKATRCGEATRRGEGRGVAIVGAGSSRFGAFPDRASREIFVEALYLGSFSPDLFEGQGHLAPIVADWVGLTPKPAVRVEGACASSGLALRQGVMAIASGLHDLVLVGGVERMTALPTEQVTDVLAAASDALYEAAVGFTFPGVFAVMATAYLDRYGASPEHLWRVAIKNHDNAALNPKAQLPRSIRALMEARQERARQRGEALPPWRDELEFLGDPQANPVVAWPLRLFDCAPISDGAACLLLCAEERARQLTDLPVHIIATAHASGGGLASWEELTSIPAARAAARQAYAMAGLGPQQIQIAEVHDCFTIAEVVALEDLGFWEPGQGAWATAEGLTARDGLLPVNTSGGLKAKGHPVGATGAAQVVELWQQLRGQAGARQVKGRELRWGLAHNVGGTGGTCVVHILERR